MSNRKSPGSSPKMETEPVTRKPTAKLGRDVQAKIGNQLRAIYDDIVQQGVPDRFVDLLNRLDKQPDKE